MSYRRLVPLLAVALAFFGAAAVSAQEDGADWLEPNNTFDTATSIAYAHGESDYIWDATLDPLGPSRKGDADFYRFQGIAGETVNIDAIARQGFPTDPAIVLMGPDTNAVLARNDNSPDVLMGTSRGSHITYVLPASGAYTVRVRSANHPNDGGLNYLYDLRVGVLDLLEPNNTLEEAVPLVYGDGVSASLDLYYDDDDYYRFDGRAGDHVVAVVSSEWVHVSLLDQDGATVLDELPDTDDTVNFLQAMLPEDGTYYLWATCPHYEYCYPYSVSLDTGLFLSTRTDGIVDGMRFKRGDLLLYQEAADRWMFARSASDWGVTGNPGGMEAEPGWRKLLLSPNPGQTRYVCPGPEGWCADVPLKPQDIYALPDPYAGDWLLDGSDVGLTTSAETIDALAVAPDGRLVISTAGSPTLPGISGGRDEDLFVFTPDTPAPDSSGTWAMYLDGSSIPGLAAEDVVGASVDALGDIYLVLQDGYTAGGVSCGPTCVIRITPDGVVSKYFDGRDHRFNYALDGVDIPSQTTLAFP